MADSTLPILAFGAHPDDVEFGCGGILLAEAARGSAITLSRGEAGSNGTPDERESEARSAAKMLDAGIEFLEMGGDCHLVVSAANTILLAKLIRRLRPGLLLSPTSQRNQHPDHIVVSQLARNAVRLTRYGGLADLRDMEPHVVRHHLEYAITPAAELPNDRPKICIAIDAHFEKWIELMECHRSQLRTRRYLKLQTARARVLGLTTGAEYAQALFPTGDWRVESLSALPAEVRLF